MSKNPEYLNVKSTIYYMVFYSRFEERADTGRGFADDQVIQHLFFWEPVGYLVVNALVWACG